jgi:hypothetical protein
VLVLGVPPPVKVRGLAERIEIPTAISTRLTNVAAREDLGLTDRELVERIPEVTSWITWSEIREVVIRGRDQLQVETEFAGTLSRLCEATVARDRLALRTITSVGVLQERRRAAEQLQTMHFAAGEPTVRRVRAVPSERINCSLRRRMGIVDVRPLR